MVKMKLLYALFAIFFPNFVICKTIIGIDLGSLFMKVALVQRNSPIEIVTNLHSKRKTEQMILFDSGVRFYGADANSLIARKPLLTPTSMSLYLGRGEEHPSVQVLAERYYPIQPSFSQNRSGVCLTVAGETFTPEELVAMILSHAKDITAAYGAGAQTRDCVLTVPSFYTQHERLSLIDAASLADLNILALIDETTAAGLHFGIDRIDKDPFNVLFYNMGASALQVSIIRYYSYERKESRYDKPKRVGAFQVLGKAWDATLGGQAFDARIVEYMADEFNVIWNKKRNDGQNHDVRNYPRPMAKLRIQANKAKHVLSANSDIPIFIDSLYDDINYQSHITRPIIEDLCHDLFSRSTEPIHFALKSANLTLNDIHSVELIGGGIRIPKLQEEIRTTLGETLELGLHMNTDESMALGAAFHGANVSTAFRVRHVGMTDINPFSVSVFLSDLVSNQSPRKGIFGFGAESSNTKETFDSIWSKNATLFKRNGKLGIKKTIVFTHDRDVTCMVSYESTDSLPVGTELSIEHHNITGITDFSNEMTGKGLSKPKVSLQFEMSTSGLIRLLKAEAVVEEILVEDSDFTNIDLNRTKTDNTAIDPLSNKNDFSTNLKDDNSSSYERHDLSTNETINVTNINNTKILIEPKKVQKEHKRLHKRILRVISYYTGRIKPYSHEVMEESRTKLNELARKDEERIMLDESRNKFESYIYHIKNRFSDERDAIAAVSTVNQRESILKSADDAEEWLYQHGYDTDLKTFEAKFTELSDPAEKIFFRVVEAAARPKAISEMKKKLLKVENLVHTFEKSLPHTTVEERSSVLMKVEDVYKWISEKEHAQDELGPTMDPVFTSEEVSFQYKPLETLIATLRKKPKPMVKNEMENNETTDNDASTDLNDDNTTGEGYTNNSSNFTIFDNVIGEERNKIDEF